MAEKSGLVRQHITADADDHVFVLIECEGRPTISLDLSNPHGRRSLRVRSDGMGIASILVDVDDIGPGGDPERFARFCPYCGEAFDLFSSVNRHRCPRQEGA